MQEFIPRALGQGPDLGIGAAQAFGQGLAGEREQLDLQRRLGLAEPVDFRAREDSAADLAERDHVGGTPAAREQGELAEAHEPGLPHTLQLWRDPRRGPFWFVAVHVLMWPRAASAVRAVRTMAAECSTATSP